MKIWDEMMKRLKQLQCRVLLMVLSICLSGNLVNGQTLGSLHLSAYQSDDLIIEKGTELEEALRNVEERFNIVFLYRTRILDNKETNTRKSLPNDVEKALTKLLEDQELVFKYINPKTYGIYEMPRKDKASSAIAEKVSGTVKDANTGETMPGVNILVKGTTAGTSTDSQGNFNLTVPSLRDTLIFSFIGYKTREVPINGRIEMDIELSPETVVGDEVVVVGYGTQERESVIAGVTSVTEGDLEQSGDVPSLGMALTGKVPGVVTVSSTGLPGDEDPQILVRGQSTWQDSSPLILVDGVERSMNSIDKSEVESITVLKDASATAVYGVRGANGVILIQTKSGYEGQIEISGSFRSTIKAPSKLPNIKDSYEALKLRNKAIEYELGASPNSWTAYRDPEFIGHYQKPQTEEERVRYANVDWSDVLFRNNARAYDANLNVRGGSEFVQFFASANYLNEGDLFREFNNNRGYQPGFGFQRLNARSNLDFQITPSTTLKAKLSGSYGVRKRPWDFSGNDYSFWVAAYSTAPDRYLPRYPDGSYGYDTQGGGVNSLETLALSGIERTTNTQLTTNFVLDQNLDMLVKGLNIKGQLAVDNTFVEGNRGINDQFNDARVKYVNPVDGSVNFERLYDSNTPFDFRPGSVWNTDGGQVENSQTYRRVYYQLQLNYDFTLGEKHNFSEMGLVNRTQNAVGSEIPHARENWVFRSTYNYNQKYILEYNGSYNGSEKFGEGYRFGFFSSGGIGWNIHKENFMSSLDFLNNFKLRASYGKIGDDNTNGRWLYRTEWSYGGEDGVPMQTTGWQPPNSTYEWYSVESLGNPNVRWATVTKANIGLDFGFLDGLISGTVDVFRDRREDILISGTERAIPSYFGQDAPVINLGEVENQGYEFTLNLNHRFGNGLRLWTEMNMTHAENEVIERDDPELLPAYQKQEGFAVGQARTHIDNGFYDSWDEVYGTTPFNTNDASKLPGGKYIIDYNGDGIIDSEDSVPYGYSGTPQNTYNTTFGFDWFGFSGYVQFYGVNNVTRWINFSSLGEQNLVYTVEGGYWSMDNSDANTQIPRWNSEVNGAIDGHRNMYDGSYVRLKNAQIGYTFDSNSAVARNLGISSLRIYVNGNNLLLWTDLPDDRESNFAGGDVPSQGAYPTIKRYNFGININF